MNKPELSIIVPVYNVEEFLVECLDSLFNQELEHERFEVIAVNDGATDNSLDVLNTYQKEHPDYPIEIYTFENSGLATTRNRGIDIARGKYITFLDSDDTVPYKAYAKMLDTLKMTGSDVVTGPVMRVEGERKSRSGLHKYVGFDAKLKTNFSEYCSLVYDTTSTNKIYKTSFLKENNLYFTAGLLYEDILFTQQMYLVANSVDVITDNVYNWRIREGENKSISQNRTNIKGYDDRVNSLIKLLELNDLVGSVELRLALEERILKVDLPIFARKYEAEHSEFFNFFVEKTRELLLYLSKESIESADYRVQMICYAIQNNKLNLLKEGYANLTRKQVFDSSGLISRDEYYTEDAVKNIRFDQSLLILPRVNTVQFKNGLFIIDGVVTSRHMFFGAENEKIQAFLVNERGERTLEITVNTLGNSDNAYIPYKIKFKESDLSLDSTYKIELMYSITDDISGSAFLSEPLKSGNGSKLFSRENKMFYSADYNFGWDLLIRKEKIETVLSNYQIKNDKLIIEGDFSDDFSKEVALSFERNKDIRPNVTPDKLIFDLTEIKTGIKGELFYIKNGRRSYAYEWLSLDSQFSVNQSPDSEVEYITRRFNVTHTLSLKKDYKHSSLLKVNPKANKIQLIAKIPTEMLEYSLSLVKVIIKDTVSGEETRVRAVGVRGHVKFIISPTTFTKFGRHLVYLEFNCKSGDKVRSQLLDTKNIAASLARKPVGLTYYDFETADGYQFYLYSEGGVEKSKFKYIFYRVCRKLPINKNKFVFQSYWGKEASCNPRGLFDYMKDTPEYSGNKLVWVMDSKDKKVDGAINVIPQSIGYYYHMATAGYFFNNVNFTSPYLKRNEATEVQTMHGTPLKTIGLDAENSFNSERAVTAFKQKIKRWDYVISQSEYVDGIIKTAYDYSGKILRTGYPRNDKLMMDVTLKKEVFVPGKKTIVYAPTWRTTSRFNLQLDIERMREALSSEYVLIIKPHHYEEKFLDGEIIDNDFVFDGRDFESLNELLLISDMLITDYSSIMIDYLVQNKPVYVFSYDYAYYTSDQSRGLYFDMKVNFSGIFSETTDELIGLIKNTATQDEVYNHIRNKFITYERNDSSQAVLNEIIK